MNIQIKWVNSKKELDLHAQVWDGLVLESKQQLPMLSYSWVASYFDCMLAPSESWECALAFDDGKLVGVMPFIRRSAAVLGKKVHYLRTPFDPHTRSGDAVVKEGYEKSVIHAFQEAAWRIKPGYFSIEMRGVVASSPTLSALKEGSSGTHIITDFSGYGSFLPITGTFEEYRAGLSSNFTGNIRKARNKLLKLGDHELVCLSGKDATEAWLMPFMELEASGWKGREGTALLQDPLLVKFYSTLVRRLAERGWLEWHLLKLEDKLIAAHLGVRLGRTLVLLKIAYDESYSQCAPGNILFHGVVERAYRAGDTQWIDCLTDMPWHNNWEMEKREYLNIFLFPGRLLPLFFNFIPLKLYYRVRKNQVLKKAARYCMSRMPASLSKKKHLKRAQ